MRVPRSFSRLLSTSLCLLLIYTLAGSLCAPFSPRKIMAASGPEIISRKSSPRAPVKAAPQKSRWRDAELLAHFKADAPASEVDTILWANGASRAGRLRGQSGVERLRLPAGSDPEAIAGLLRTSGLVDFAEPNYLIEADEITPDDPRFSEQWALRNTGEAGGQFGSDMRAAKAWGITTGSKRTVIAVLDSGVDFTHPDLYNNRWDNPSEQNNQQDDDRDGFADDLNGWDFVADSNEVKDAQGHGTAVAGIIAARGNNSVGVAGVMWRASLMSLRVLDDTGTGDVAGAVEALDYASAHGAQVVNCSWGTDGESAALREAIARAGRRGVVVVAAAGNSGRDIEAASRYPASYDLDNLIAVASTDGSDLPAQWSNWGGAHVKVAAPGADILTTKTGGGYHTVRGTSASAALVTGIAGLVKTKRPWLNADRTRELIVQNVRQLASLSGKVSSGGVVDAAATLDASEKLPPAEGSEGGNGNNGGRHGKEDGAANIGGNDADLIGADDFSDLYRVAPLPTTSGAPGPNLPNLDELRRKQPTVPQAKPPIPSDRCSHRNPLCRDSQAVGDTISASNLDPSRMLAWSLELPDVGGLLQRVSGMVSDSESPLALFAAAPTPLAPPLPPTPPVEDSVWTNAVGVTVPGNTLKKTAAAGWTNAGASSSKSIAAGDGYVEFTVTETNLHRRFGLSNGDASQNFTEIDYCIYAEATGKLYINENGAALGQFGTYTASDTLRVAIEGGVVKYYKNATLLYTSNVTPTYPLLADTSLYSTGATVTNAHISGMLQGNAPAEDVVWVPASVVGATASGNDLTKTNPTTGWNAGAVSTKSIPFGDCYVEFTVGETNTSRIVGLSNGDSTQSYTDITFGLNLNFAGIIYIHENGVSRGTFGTYATGDRMRVSVQDGVVRYWKNGTLLYKSDLNPTYPLLVDTALYSQNATITDVVLSHEPNNNQGGPNYQGARLDPLNRTGEQGVDMLSRNINWSLPLVGLPGRAGLDLGLSLSYNSLVWTKAGSTITFDSDNGTPSPGFRLGFPTIRQPYYNDQLDRYAYLLITPSGKRVELRQSPDYPNVYESEDSSNLQLIDYGDTTLLLRDMSGTGYLFALSGGEYHCTKIKDRNGNFISVTYRSDGQISTITDTLARVITFNYDANQNLISITQPWAGYAQPHVWATFGWENVTLDTTFTNLTVIGPDDNTVLPLLSQVSLADGTHYEFDYNTRGQVTTVKHFAADSTPITDEHLLSQTAYTIVASSTDCPRPSQQKQWAEYWNGDANAAWAAAEEAVTDYTFDVGVSGEAEMPDNTTIYKEFFDTTPGWKKGLTTSSGYWVGATNKKLTTLTWTQDDEGLSYQKNPRPTEITVADGTNTRKTAISYTAFGLPVNVDEFNANGTAVLRRTHTDYHIEPDEYSDSHVLGLPVRTIVYEGTTTVVSKVEYEYDEAGAFFVVQTVSTNHDTANYGTGYRLGRGNVTSIKRFDAQYPNDATKVIESNIGYNNSGSVILTRDPLGRQTDISYADDFSDATKNGNIRAYPTKVTPPLASGETAAHFESKIQYNYDFGAVTRTQGPRPSGQTAGAEQTMEYDAAGRITKSKNMVNNGYRRWVYEPAGHLSIYDTPNSTTAEAYSTVIHDGAGRVRSTGGDNPNSTGLYRAQYTVYDVMGRPSQTSNMTEINSAWAPVGDDTGGWVYTTQAYDWQGRPTLTTNSDGTTSEATYGGCGCAGGAVVTLRDEMGRRQRSTVDILGRTVKTEVLNWDPTTVYSTTTNTYNALDQVTSVLQQVGSSGTGQTTTTTYDGYGRVKTHQAPEQTAQMQLAYNADDTVSQKTDGRGSVSAFTYNVRRQVTNVTYTPSSGIAATPSVTYTYDAAGNRTSMDDGPGQVTYSYNRLSQLVSETRTFDGITDSTKRSRTLTYEYTLGGALKTITDPFTDSVSRTHDSIGRITAVTGSSYAGVTQYASNVKYRAWGGVKEATFGDGKFSTTAYNGRMQPTQFRLTNNGSSVLREDFSFYADGRLQQITDLDDTQGSTPPATFRFMSRGYSYDHAGRVTSAGGLGTQAASPFLQSYAYDAFDNMTSRSGTYGYVMSQSDGGTYTNNKRNGWTYDADGRLRISPANSTSNARDWTYDAAGRLITTVETTSTSTQTTLTNEYDGDGQIVYESVTVGAGTPTIYYMVRSSVLGGEVVSRVTTAGNKFITYVSAGGLVSARQAINSNGQQMQWSHFDPAGVTEQGTSGLAAYDPLGNYAPLPAPPPSGQLPPPTGMYGPSYTGGLSILNNANNFSTGCTMDGTPWNCNGVQHANNTGQTRSINISTPGGADMLFAAGWGSALSVAVIPGYKSRDGSRQTLANLHPVQVLEGDWIPTTFIVPGNQLDSEPSVSQPPQDTFTISGPDVIDNKGKGQSCTISVSFKGDSPIGLKNGPSELNSRVGPVLGVGFTVTVSNLGSGGIKSLAGHPVLNPKEGGWTISQEAGISSRMTWRFGDIIPVTEPLPLYDDPQDPDVRFNNEEGRSAGWYDHPGFNRVYNGQFLIAGYARFNFLVKGVKGRAKCELGFHIDMRYSNGNFSAQVGRGIGQ